MATEKRTIRGEKFVIADIVDEAIANAAETQNMSEARAYLNRMGHTCPTEELINKVAMETAILKHLEKMTGAAFLSQLGKISFVNRDEAIQKVNAYLNRRNQAAKSRWGK